MVTGTVQGLFLSLAFVFANVCFGDDEPPKLKPADCPAPVVKTIELESKGAKIENVVKIVFEEETTYQARFVMNSRHYRIDVNEDGTLNELSLDVTDDEIEFSKAPPAVQSMFRKESSKETKFDTLIKDMKYGVTIYEAIVAVGNKEYSIIVAENGVLVEKMLIFAEDQIDLANCPAAVQAALKEHARDGKIGEITRSTGIAGHVYETQLEIEGKTYFLELTEGGNLITKTFLDDVDEN